MNEKILLVDAYDNVTGSCDKLEAHRRGLLHRAFSVFLIRGNSMLIQRRAEGKYHSAGLWANSCCSHQHENETLDEAVHRRVFQELGMKCDVEELFSFVYHCRFENGLSEYEYDHVFAGTFTGELSPDSEEISELMWVDFDELARRLVDSPEEFAEWFLIAAPTVMKILRH